MALVEAWISNRLRTYQPLVDLIESRVYPIIAPEDVDNVPETPKPYITFARVNTTRSYASGSDGPKQDGLPVVLFHIDCWCRDYATLKQVEDVCREAIDGYREDSDKFKVRRAFINDEYDIISDPEFDEEKPTFGARFELEVKHVEKVN